MARQSDATADEGLYAVRCSGYFFSPGTNWLGRKIRRFYVLRGGIVMCYVDEAAFDSRSAPLYSMTLTPLTGVARRGQTLVIETEPTASGDHITSRTSTSWFIPTSTGPSEGVLQLEAEDIADAVFWEKEISIHLQELFGGVRDRQSVVGSFADQLAEDVESGEDTPEEPDNLALSPEGDVELVERNSNSDPASRAASTPKRRFRTFEELAVAYITLCWARTGQLEKVRRYIERNPRDQVDVMNLFRAAVRFKQYELVEYFLEELGVDVNTTNLYGHTPVWFSVGQLSTPDANNKMLKYLVSKGADVTLIDPFGQNMLHWAATSGDGSTIEYLVREHKLDILRQDRYGATPLHMAAMWGNLSAVKTICELGGYNTLRARWLEMFELNYVPLINDFHRAAYQEWRKRGVLRCAERLSPLGVAIMHQEKIISATLIGGCEDGSVKMHYRQSLIQENCTDLCLVSKTWPNHLGWVFDAFIQSTQMNTGFITRKYALKELYGEPNMLTEHTPLAIVLKTGRAELFDHRVIDNLVKLKWQLYGRRKYLLEFVAYAFLLLVFLIGFVSVPGNDGQAWRLIAAVCCCYFLLREEACELLSASKPVVYFQSGWNWVAVIGYVLTIVAAGLDTWDPNFKYLNLLVAPAGLCLLLRTMEHLAVWKTTGILIAMLRIMLEDTARWSLMYILYVLGFSLTLFALLRGEEGHETFASTLVTMILCTVGNMSPPQSPSVAIEVTASVIMLIFVLLVTILYLNLLIAIMTLSFESVITRAEAEATMNQAQALLRWEATLSTSKKAELFKLLSPNPGERHLLTLKNGWFGRANAEVVIDEHYVTVVEALDIQEKSSHQRFKEAIARSEDKIAALESSMKLFKEKLAHLASQYKQ